MFRFAKASAPDQRLIRKFQFISAGRAATMFDVTLEYTPPETLNEQHEREQTRIVGQRRFGGHEDLKENQLAIRTAWHGILASRVQRIEGMTARKLSTLASLDPTEIANVEGGLDAPIEINPADTTEIPEEKREALGCTKETKTVGQLASQNIFWLVNACAEFRQFIETIIKDVGYFQDKDWEKQIKN